MSYRIKDITAMLDQVGLLAASQGFGPIYNRAISQEQGLLQILGTLLETEIAARAQRSAQLRLKLSNLNTALTLDSFDWDYPQGLDKTLLAELSQCHWVDLGRHIVLLGLPGLGKTHLANALGMQALNAGHTVYFTTLRRMVEDLTQADRDEKLSNRWKKYRRPGILIVDEMGFMPLTMAQTGYVYDLVDWRTSKGSPMIITSNYEPDQWVKIFTDPVATASICDRLIGNGHILNIRGNSYRMTH